jgi:hypothetical protein
LLCRECCPWQPKSESLWLIIISSTCNWWRPKWHGITPATRVHLLDIHLGVCVCMFFAWALALCALRHGRYLGRIVEVTSGPLYEKAAISGTKTNTQIQPIFVLKGLKKKKDLFVSFFIIFFFPCESPGVVKEQLFSFLSLQLAVYIYIYGCVYKRSIKWRQRQEVYEEEEEEEEDD